MLSLLPRPERGRRKGLGMRQSCAILSLCGEDSHQNIARHYLVHTYTNGVK